MNFRHAGKFGDIIYSLPVIRHYGGGVLYLERCAPFIRPAMAWETFEAIVPLLKAQPYIEDVLPWGNEHCDVNLNDFRSLCFDALAKNRLLAMRVAIWEWYSQAHGVPREEWSKPWLTCQVTGCGSPVIVHRGINYHNPRFPWNRVAAKYGHAAVQIGVQGESLPGIHFVSTPTVLQMATMIASSRIFIGNQSIGYAIAEALKKPAVLEIWPVWPNCIFNRPDVWHGWNENVHLPELWWES